MSDKKLTGLIILSMLIPLIMITCSKKEPMPEKVSASHILIQFKGAEKAPEEVRRTKQEALDEITKLLERIRAGEDFAELARQYSEDPSSARGGDIGEFSKGDFAKPFEDAAFSLKKDEVSDVIETRLGFHIIKRN